MCTWRQTAFRAVVDTQLAGAGAGADEVLPPEPPAYRVLTVVVDGFGRSLTFHRAAEGDVAGAVTGVTDGAGRRFHMALTTQAQRAEASRKQRASSLSSPASPRSVSSSQVFPDTLPAGTEYGADNGIRLEAVWLTHDPAYPDEQPTAPLARYTYTAGGELRAVYDRSGTQVRGFTYDAEHTGRMVAHHYAGRPESRYRYDDTGRVTEQVNPEGLDYRFEYGESRVIITDSLNRREVLYTEGEGGLKRVVKKEHADGSITRSEYDEAGRLKAQTDAAGRRTEYRLHMASGKLTSVILPDGRTVRYGYNSQRQVTSVTYPDGLRSSRKYDRQGRLAEETSRNGNITRWFYDSSRSGLPCAVEDGTGVRRRITRNRYGQLQAFTDCSGYTTRYEYDRYGQQIAVHREEGISTYSSYNPCGQLVSQRDAQGRETRYEYSAAGDLTATVSPDGKRSTIEYDKRGRPVSVTEGGLTRSMGYDAAGRITVLTNENGSQSTFRYDPVDRLTEQRGFDGRTQRYQYDLTGKLTQSEDEGLITLWHYDASDRITRRTVNGEPAEQWQYDDHGWLTEISHLSEGHRVAVHYGYDDKGRLTGERQTVENPETGEMLWEHETGHAYSEQGLATRQEPDGLPPVEWLTYGSGYLAGMKLGETSAQHLQQSLRLPGQQYDEESGLYYNRNRYYDPLQGRYITQDPIGLRGEWNLYKYPLNPVRFIDSLGLKFHVNGDPSDFNQAVEYLKQDSQMKETIDFLSSSEETINIEYIEGTNVRFNSNNMTIYWNSRASLFCSTELNSKSQSPALGLGHEFAHAQYYLLDKENFMALLSRTDKKYENKEEARVITIIELRAAKTLGECTRGAHSGLPFYRVDGPLQTMKITGTPE